LVLVCRTEFEFHKIQLKESDVLNPGRIESGIKGDWRENFMVFKLGVEPRNDFYELELSNAAHKLVTELRPAAGKQVLITADSSSDMRVAKATAAAVYTVGGVPTLISYHTLDEPMMEPPKPVFGAAQHADIWYNFSVAYQLYSPAYHAAVEKGCIYVELTGMDVDMMVRTIGRVDYRPMDEMKRWLYQESQKVETVRVTTELGTDLRMTIDKAGDKFWEDPPAEEGFGQMLGGQSGFMAYRESYEGVLIFDGTIWPPSEIGLLRTPVKLTLEGGYIKKFEGGVEATTFERWLTDFDHQEAFLMDHACYGFNPGVASPTGRILEDERVFGCMQFGIGAAELGSPAHTDGVVLNPSVWLDDVQIEENGRYTHPDLIDFCRRMGASGYQE
jgi:leucyl aminopeptidase (aminopeptidase T)